MSPKEKRHIKSEDLYRIRSIRAAQISPDGRHVVFSVERADKTTQKKHSNLWVVPTRVGRARQFTYGDQVDVKPKWSPDARQIAFLSNRSHQKQSQIYLIPFGGGEARPLTSLKGTFSDFEWSPDGKALVCSFRKKDREEIDREKDERKKKLGRVCRPIDRLFYKEDGEGFLPRERWHIWIINASTGKARQLTDGRIHDEHSPRFSPDGRYVVFCSNRSRDPDLDPEAVDIYLVPARGGRLRKLGTPYGDKRLPAFSPDGSRVAYFGREGRGNWWRNQGLWVVPTKPGRRQKARNLLADTGLSASCDTINDITGIFEQTPPMWSSDGKSIFFQVSRHGSTELVSVVLEAGKNGINTVLSGPGVVGDFSFDAAGEKLAYLFADMRSPGEVWVRDRKEAQPRRLTSVNGRVLRDVDLGEIEEAWLKRPGRGDLHGWIIKPPGFRNGKKYPLILEIHGGPWCQYGHFFMHEFYFLAAQGYVVCFCNPRGSTGYGEQHAKAIWNNWGTADYADLMAWAEYVAGRPCVDARRMGVTGGSYGGYMTNWIIGHTNRFRAAVTQRSVSNLVSMWGSSDFNWYLQRELGDRPPWEILDNYWRQSPLKSIAKARTPTLVMHSEQDFRCALEQGEQVYVALKKLGVPTELVVFPGESHDLSRSGRTDRRIERLKHILRWFDRYLKGKTSSNPATP